MRIRQIRSKFALCNMRRLKQSVQYVAALISDAKNTLFAHTNTRQRQLHKACLCFAKTHKCGYYYEAASTASQKIARNRKQQLAATASTVRKLKRSSQMEQKYSVQKYSSCYPLTCNLPNAANGSAAAAQKALFERWTRSRRKIGVKNRRKFR
jgi:hypothetical protein